MIPKARYYVIKWGATTADLSWLKLRKGGRADWIQDETKASFFNNINRAEAFVRGLGAKYVKENDVQVWHRAPNTWL